MMMMTMVSVVMMMSMWWLQWCWRRCLWWRYNLPTITGKRPGIIAHSYWTIHWGHLHIDDDDDDDDDGDDDDGDEIDDNDDWDDNNIFTIEAAELRQAGVRHTSRAPE